MVILPKHSRHLWQIGDENTQYIVLGLFSLAVGLLALKWRKRQIVCTAALVCVVQTALVLYEKYPVAHFEEGLLPKPAALPITFKHKPNIYLFVLESYADNETLRDIYHMSSDDLLETLREQNFTIWDDCFANYDHTLGSLPVIFLMKHHYHRYRFSTRDLPIELWDSFSGASYVCLTLRSNGYRIGMMDCLGRELYGKNLASLFKKGDLDFCYLPSYELHAFEKIADNIGLSAVYEFVKRFANQWAQLLKGREFPFCTDPEECFSAYVQEKSDTPRFVLIFTGADHSPPSGSVLEEPGTFVAWEENYKKIRRNADADLSAKLKLIQKYDPGALVVLIGDHGPRRHRGIEGKEGEVNAAMRSRGVDPRFVARDALGVLCAIKWPVPHYSQGRSISHISLFWHIFAALSGNSSLIEQAEPDDSYLSDGKRRVFKAVEHGKLMEHWVQIAEYPATP
jgi:hypothetical protein